MGVRIEMLWEVWRITEWKDGCVFKTEYVESRWLPVGSVMKEMRPDGDENLTWVSLSTDKSKRDRGMRTVRFEECTQCKRPNFHTSEEHADAG
jgi:hypothetical protein